MSGWGTGWGKLNTEPTEYSKEVIEKWGAPENVKNQLATIDKEYSDLFQIGVSPEMLGVKQEGENAIHDIPKFLNKKPTHDPYTNPNAHIYYECACGAILDPGTKSFAQLNNCASDQGWKVRWGAESYVPYCVKCGEDVE